MAVLIIVSYATGMLLSSAVVLPFMVLSYLFSYLGTVILVSLARSRSKLPIQPSSRPAFRRAASVVLGSAMVPQVPDMNATALVEKLLALFGKKDNEQASESHQASIPDEVQLQLKLEAVKMFAPDFEEQWNDMQKGLYQLQMRERNPSEALIGLEPTLSVAAAIIVWRWLSFPIPLALNWAATVTFTYFGVTLLLLGIGHGIDYMDSSSQLSFLFEQLLDRSKGVKGKE
jgi:hypothetical protein